MDGIQTGHVKINRGVYQGTAFGPLLFSIMLIDVTPVNL
jgi:hypothetical protein